MSIQIESVSAAALHRSRRSRIELSSSADSSLGVLISTVNSAPVDPSLREALGRITTNYGGRNVCAQVAEVEHLRKRFPHSIAAVQLVADATPGAGQFTCFMHALDLSSPPELVVRIMERFDFVYPGADFIQSLIGHQLLDAVSEAEDDDILIYFAGDLPQHAGKAHDGIVESKWGLGHTWQHPVFEVPDSYGDRVLAFRRVGGDMAARWFVNYATAKVGADIIAELEALDA